MAGFFTFREQQEALNRAIVAGMPGNYEFEIEVGEGYVKGGVTYFRGNEVKVLFNANNRPITTFVLRPVQQSPTVLTPMSPRTPRGGR